MSTTFYGIGTHCLVYKAGAFGTGLTVTAYIWNPSLTKSALQTFTEVSDGLYYLDYNFTALGTYFGKFYEDGSETTTGVFRIEVTPPTAAAIKTAMEAAGSYLKLIKAQTDDQPAGIKKGVALNNFEFLMIDSTDHVTPKTGLTITAQISKDGGAFAGCVNAVAEISAGVYKISLSAAEVSADIFTLKFTAAGADQRTITIKTSA